MKLALVSVFVGITKLLEQQICAPASDWPGGRDRGTEGDTTSHWLRLLNGLLYVRAGGGWANGIACYLPRWRGGLLFESKRSPENPCIVLCCGAVGAGSDLRHVAVTVAYQNQIRITP